MQARYIIITALLVAAVVAVCGLAISETPAPTAIRATLTPGESLYPMTISDYYDRTATLTHAPERIVSTSAANTEILFALGLGDKIVGVDEYSDYPAEAKNITHVSGFAEVSYEKITAANPDVIFAEDIIGEEAVTKLRELGFQVIEVKNSNLTMIRKSIELMGIATNTSGKAAALINRIDAEVANVSAKTAGLNETQKPKVLLVTGLFSDETIYPFGNGTYGDELLTLAGARNAAKNITLYGVMSHEVILMEDPDMIIVPVDDISRSSYEAFKNGSMTWATGLSAYKNGKVYEVDANIMNRPSPRLAEAGRIIAEIIHPSTVTPVPTTPTPAPAPGFEMIFALAGLLGVTYLVARRFN